MNPIARPQKTLSTFALAGAVIALTACSALTLGEQRKGESEPLRGNSDSDYAILSCGELSLIETSARQRYSRLDSVTENRAEQELLLRSQINEIVTNREALGCPVPRSATLMPLTNEAQTVDTTPVVKPAAKPAPQSTAQSVAQPTPQPTVAQTQPTAASGRFLQIGTFGDPTNAQAAADYFASRGFRAETRVSSDAGAKNHRVLVGPLRTDQDRARASNAAQAFGVNDAFITDG